MLHANFEALVTNISSIIADLPAGDLSMLVIGNDDLKISDRGVTDARTIRHLLGGQSIGMVDVVWDQELKDAFAHNNLEFVELGNGLAYGLRRTSMYTDEPKVFWFWRNNKIDSKVAARLAREVTADIKENADRLLEFNIEDNSINCYAMNWLQLRKFLLNHPHPTARFRLASVPDYDFSLSAKSINYYLNTMIYTPHPADPVAYHNEVNLFNPNDFLDSANHWSIAPDDSQRPLVKVFV